MTTTRKTLAILGFLLGGAVASAQQGAPSPLFPSQQVNSYAPPLPYAPQYGNPAQGQNQEPLVTSEPLAIPYQTRPGCVESPWCGNNHAGCDGPIGGNGSVQYEIYLRTGPNILTGANAFNGAIHDGWTVQGGGRTLFFNRAQDAAWVLDIGLGYTRNQGLGLSAPVNVAPSALKFGDVTNNTPIPYGIRFLNRTSLNFGVGRDWYLNPPQATGEDIFGNWRFGSDVGGRYGTASVGFEPGFEPGGSRRLQNTFTGVYIGTGLTWEKQVGLWAFTAGVRGEWSYSWMDMLPPNASDISDVNILLHFGIKY